MGGILTIVNVNTSKTVMMVFEIRSINTTYYNIIKDFLCKLSYIFSIFSYGCIGTLVTLVIAIIIIIIVVVVVVN